MIPSHADFHDCYTHLATYPLDMTGFEPATHHIVGHCTVYLAAEPLAPQGTSLTVNPLARVQFPVGIPHKTLIRHPIYIKFPLYRYFLCCVSHAIPLPRPRS